MRRTFRAMGLHALAYCERLFYLEEIEELYVADDRVWAGRRLHEELDEGDDVVQLTLESSRIGVRGKLDAVRKRDGSWFPVEHKRGRAMRQADKATAWPSDALQATAYALLLEEHIGEPVTEGRIRYHGDNTTVRIAIDEAARRELTFAVSRAESLASSTVRPPVTENERLCVRCSLAPVCLPEEARLAERPETTEETVRLYPADLERRSLHVITQGAKVGRSNGSLTTVREDGVKVAVGIREVSDVVIHGHAQITTQALRLCADEDVSVHFVTQSGAHIGTFVPTIGGVQRRVRQYDALTRPDFRHSLARRLVAAKVEMQLRHLLRASRDSAETRKQIQGSVDAIRASLRNIAAAANGLGLMGYEGQGAKAYFAAMPHLLSAQADERFRPDGRSKRPPRDRFNALLSFGYGLLHRDIASSILRAGLEPAFGLLHEPHSAAHPLVLDLTELFRVPMVDIPVLGAVNRRTFDADTDFVATDAQVWLSDSGRTKLIELYERRKHEVYRHPVLNYSLSYGRMMELEARLLEKEWSGEPGLFARLRMR